MDLCQTPELEPTQMLAGLAHRLRRHVESASFEQRARDSDGCDDTLLANEYAVEVTDLLDGPLLLCEFRQHGGPEGIRNGDHPPGPR